MLAIIMFSPMTRCVSAYLCVCVIVVVRVENSLCDARAACFPASLSPDQQLKRPRHDPRRVHPPALGGEMCESHLLLLGKSQIPYGSRNKNLLVLVSILKTADVTSPNTFRIPLPHPSQRPPSSSPLQPKPERQRPALNEAH